MKDTLAWAGAWKPDPGPVLGPLHGPPAPSMTASARRCEFATRSRDSSMVARRREGREGEEASGVGERGDEAGGRRAVAGATDWGR